MEQDIINLLAAEAERARQLVADRAKRYRAAMKANGRPAAREVDAAIAEAVAFLTSIATDPAKIVIDVAELHRVATMCLHRDGYKRSYSRIAVSQRMQPRPVHDDLTLMPSRRLTQTSSIIQPPERGSWTEDEIGFMRGLLVRWRQFVRPAS